MKLKSKTTFVFLFFIGNLFSQPNTNFEILKYDDFQNLVINFHPIAKKAKLNPEIGTATLMEAKGNFDPKIYANINQKYLNDYKYFSQIGTSLKWQNNSPISLQGGYDINSGLYLNPENYIPGGGLIYGGISVSVLQGLLINETRATVRKAELLNELSEIQKRQILNDILIESGTAYWNWFLAYQKLTVFDSSYTLAKNRFNFIKASAELGDRPFYDTIESHIYMQNIEAGYNQVKLEYQNFSLLLSLYLWDENEANLELKSSTIPPNWKSLTIIDSIIDKEKVITLINSHPEILSYSNQIKQFDIDKKWYKEQLKPELDLNYNLLNLPVGGESFSLNNYKWGLSFSFPLLLRKARGGLEKTELKMLAYNYEMLFKYESIKTKVNSSLNEIDFLIQQHSLYESIVKNLYRLVLGENELFQVGESSIFLVNSREQSFLNNEVKWLENFTKLKMEYLKLEYQVGQLGK